MTPWLGFRALEDGVDGAGVLAEGDWLLVAEGRRAVVAAEDAAAEAGSWLLSLLATYIFSLANREPGLFTAKVRTQLL